MLGTTIQTYTPIIMRLPSHAEEKPVAASGLGSSVSLSSCKWNYRGEGNANLVLALPFEKVIIRLRKCPKNETIEETAALIRREAEFCRAIMLPLLGSCYVHVPKVVRIPERELRLLNQQLRPLRPVHRHHKSVFGSIAAVFPDLCLLPRSSTSGVPTFCVEIKPKQGWIPLADRRLPKCTFCLNQFLKLKSNTTIERSGYCPLDLFSGDAQRMRSALKALLRTPQNNFKMFCDGKLEYGEENLSFLHVLQNWFGAHQSESSLIDNLCEVVTQALLADFEDPPVLPAEESWPTKATSSFSRIPQHLLQRARLLLNEPSCFRPTSGLPSGCILSRILRVQALDVLGSDEVYHRFSAASYNDYDYVTDFIEQKNVFHPLHSYLLATTAKDCSILIAFQRVDVEDIVNDPKIAEDMNGSKYLFNIGVSDLDPKPMSCIERHRKRDIEVVRACVELLENINLCQTSPLRGVNG